MTKFSNSCDARLSRLRRRMVKLLEAKNKETIEIIERVRRKEFDSGYTAGYSSALFNYGPGPNFKINPFSDLKHF